MQSVEDTKAVDKRHEEFLNYLIKLMNDELGVTDDEDSATPTKAEKNIMAQKYGLLAPNLHPEGKWLKHPKFEKKRLWQEKNRRG